MTKSSYVLHFHCKDQDTAKLLEGTLVQVGISANVMSTNTVVVVDPEANPEWDFGLSMLRLLRFMLLRIYKDALISIRRWDRV